MEAEQDPSGGVSRVCVGFPPLFYPLLLFVTRPLFLLTQGPVTRAGRRLYKLCPQSLPPRWASCPLTSPPSI